MPDRGRFDSEVHLYSTLLHEVSHWSGAKHRLDRDLTGRSGSQGYAVEELIAELAASFLWAWRMIRAKTQPPIWRAGSPS
ncbi:hypothetical protein X737_38345 [Mesorhizobium sp. L48C026A00]|nr:hypothetical protein X737_38345 [Mesorhizobium sp. L48C026A00]